MHTSDVKQLTQECRQELAAVARRCREQINPDGKTRDLITWALDQQTRLSIFADVLGVFAEASLSLEHRLRQNPSARSALVQLLVYISYNASFCGPVQRQTVADKSSKADEGRESRNVGPDEPVDLLAATKSSALSQAAVQRITRDMATLVNFAATIRLRSMRHYEERSKKFEPQDEDGRSLLPYFEKVAARVLDDAFTNENFGQLDFLRERFRRTIVKRWRRICYCRHRFLQLRQTDAKSHRKSSTSEMLDDVAAEAKPGPQPGPLVQAAEIEASAIGQVPVATTFAGSLIAETVVPKPRSITSSVALSVSPDAAARVPRLRENATAQRNGNLEFLCVLCKIPQSLPSHPDSAKQHRVWEHHAFHDLEPYICLIRDCTTPDATYRTLDDWKAHHLANHAVTTWSCQNCEEVFEKQELFGNHLRDVHSHTLSTDELEFVAKVCIRRNPVHVACLFCGKHAAPDSEKKEDQGISSRRETLLYRCMAGHMRSLALTSLPDDLSVSDGSVHSTAKESDASMAAALLVPTDSLVLSDQVWADATTEYLFDPEVQSQQREEKSMLEAARISQFRDALSERGAEAQDFPALVRQWIDESNLESTDNVPGDKEMLSKQPEVGKEDESIIRAARITNDFIGPGPPTYGGRRLIFPDSSDVADARSSSDARYSSRSRASRRSSQRPHTVPQEANPAAAFLAAWSSGEPEETSRDPDGEGQAIGMNNEMVIGRTIALRGHSIIKELHSLDDTGQKRLQAVKIVRKNVVNASEAENEIAQMRIEHEVSVWRHLKHQHILALHAVYETDFATFCVTDLNVGGTLFDLVQESRRRMAGKGYRQGLAAHLVKRYTFQLARALDYLHNEIRVCHGDISLESCLIDMSAPKAQSRGGNLRLCHFGSADFLTNLEDESETEVRDVNQKALVDDEIRGVSQPEQHDATGASELTLDDLVGAEEVGSISYNKLHRTSSDVWAFGEVLFAVFVGKLPFHHAFRSKQAMILRDPHIWREDPAWYDARDKESQEVVRVLDGCLQPDAAKRCTIGDVLQCDWFDGYRDDEDEQT